MEDLNAAFEEQSGSDLDNLFDAQTKHVGSDGFASSGQRDLLNKAWDFVTGDDRKTEATDNYHMVDASPEFSGMSQGLAAGLEGLAENPGANMGMAFTTDPVKRMKIIQSHFPSAKFWMDAKGNPFVDLPSGSYALSKPGMHTLDVVNAVQDVLELEALGGGVGGKLLTKAATGAAAGAGSEAINQGIAGLAGGGPVSGKDIAIGGLVNAIPLPGRAKKTAEKAVENEAEQLAKTTSEPTVNDVRKAVRKAGTSVFGKDEATRELADLVQPNADILQAADNLGIGRDELLPHHYSDNAALRDVIGGMASMTDLGLQDAESALKDHMNNRIEQFITENGGDLDGSLVSQQIASGMQEEIDALTQRSKHFYDKVDDVISPMAQVAAPRTLEHLNNIADQMGGLDRLTNFEKDVSKDFGPDGVRTWAGFNDRRSDVNDFVDKFKSGDKKRDYRRGAMLAEPMKQDARAIASEHGVLDEWDKANSLYSRKENLEAELKALTGRNGQRDIIPTLSTAMKGLKDGKTSEFSRLINLIPQNQRARAVMTAFREMLSGSSAKEDLLHYPSAANWLRDVEGNAESYKALTSNMPKAAAAALPDLSTLISGIRRGRESLVANTGTKMNDMKRGIAEAGGIGSFAAKHPNVVKAARKATKPLAGTIGFATHGPAGAIVGVTAAAAMERLGGSEAVKNAADVIRSRPFIDMATALERDGEASAGAKLAHDALVKIPAFRKWWGSLLQVQKRKISASGLMQGLLNEMQAEQGRITITRGYNDSPDKT